ncbi:MBL fold metallo-hydrolase [Desulfuribacillus alkaliarsenatis]|uniref:Metallohydrolase n=1 Tax=Desulfuribacillus alkaliarsenatis TaxID=766136 RepID=A0A1E5G2Q0_9FIRM|nr:MBL fold metallo-hydrolase [Desulfuribacillus alkaliarsenatis]OEF97346.1 metallohydrolase [Desulfuribacillus alkaliarsenatis]
MVQYSVLASGSSGNAILVQSDKATILIDAGLSGRQIEAAMAEIGVSADSLSGIFVTHEHQDHVKGVGVLSRRYKVPVFANQRTWDGMERSIGEIKAGFYERFTTNDQIEIGNLAVKSFPISHDSNEPVGYCVLCGNTKLSIGTDMGYVNDKIKGFLMDSDAIIIEANHDIDMLRVGPYPWHLKQRILSDHGHLSNEAAGELLTEIISANTKCIHLAHLSKENNLPQLAHLTVKSILEEEQFKVGQEFDLEVTYPDKPTKLRAVKRR